VASTVGTTTRRHHHIILALCIVFVAITNHRVCAFSATRARIAVSTAQKQHHPPRRLQQCILAAISDALDATGDNGDSGDEPPLDVQEPDLLQLLLPASTCDVNQMSGTDLAYVGDVVFELYVRSLNVWPSMRTSNLQDVVVGTVRAENQSRLLTSIREGFDLSNKEKQVISRGRNSVTKSKNRRNPAAYQDSTAFEAFVGYLYIQDRDRLVELLQWLRPILTAPTETDGS